MDFLNQIEILLLKMSKLFKITDFLEILFKTPYSSKLFNLTCQFSGFQSFKVILQHCNNKIQNKRNFFRNFFCTLDFNLK